MLTATTLDALRFSDNHVTRGTDFMHWFQLERGVVHDLTLDM